MKFVLNASIDTLPQKTNLKQLGKLTNDKCFCGLSQTLNHVLNCCRICLDQGRYTYRHDNILLYIAKCLDRAKYTCYLDIFQLYFLKLSRYVIHVIHHLISRCRGAYSAKGKGAYSARDGHKDFIPNNTNKVNFSKGSQISNTNEDKNKKKPRTRDEEQKMYFFIMVAIFT